MRLALPALLAALVASPAPADEPGEPPIVFRWYDAQGNPHDTTDATTIPPGVKIRVRNPDFPSGDLQMKRSWWRARKARLEAEIHGALDAKAAAERDLADAVRRGVPVAEREPYRRRIRAAEQAESDGRARLQALRDEARKRRIPARWLE